MASNKQEIIDQLFKARNNVHHALQIAHTENLGSETQISTLQMILAIIRRQMQEVNHMLENYNKPGGSDETDK